MWYLTKFIIFSALLFALSSPRCVAQRYSSPPDDAVVFTSLAQALTNPEQVEYLVLKRKHLKEVPIEIQSFKNLKYLDLSRNDIHTLPIWIGELSKLEFLDLGNNKLQIIGPEIGRLQKLKILVLSHTDLGYLPDSLCTMTTLNVLDISSSNIAELPECVNGLATTLEVLNIRYLQMTRKEQERVFELLPATRVYYTAGCRCNS